MIGKKRERLRQTKRIVSLLSLVLAVRSGEIHAGEPVKRCRGCQRWKPLDRFPTASGRPHGAKCKECCRPLWNELAKRRWNANPEYRTKSAERQKVNREKYNANARKRHREDQEYAELRRAESRRSHDKHRERRNRERREKYRLNPEPIREAVYAWRLANPGKVKAVTASQVARRKADHKLRLNHRIGSSIGRCLRGAKGRRSWQKLVGYTMEDLVRHLEKHFQPGMSWENFGRWHIDHVIPLSAFNFSAPEHLDFRRAWALSNLLPMWASDNMRKHAKIDRDFQPFLRISGFK